MIQFIRDRFGSYYAAGRQAEFRSLRQALAVARELGYWTAQVRSRSGSVHTLYI